MIADVSDTATLSDEAAPANARAPLSLNTLVTWLLAHRLALFAFGVPMVLRMWASDQGLVARYQDSEGWLNPGPWLQNNRYGPVPFVLNLFEADAGRVLLQTMIGACSWSVLALTLARRSRWPRTTVCGVLVVGLLPQVIRYDVAILSESLGISFAVLAVAATVSVIDGTSPRGWLLWVGAVLLCGLTRPVHLVVVMVAAVVMAGVAVRTRTRVHLAVTGSLLIGLTFGLMFLHGNRTTAVVNISTVLSADVLPFTDRYQWFVERGMPDVDGIATAHGHDDPALLPPELLEELDLPVGQLPPQLLRVGGPEFRSWLRTDGQGTYLRYLLLHPGDTLSRLGHLASPALSPPNDDFLPLTSYQLLPRQLFSWWQLWTAVFVAGCARAALGRKRREALVLLAMGATVAAVFSGSMLLSGLEHVRHGVTSSVLVRVLALVAVVLAVGRAQLEPAATGALIEVPDEEPAAP